jgi:hypothetical protein
MKEAEFELGKAQTVLDVLKEGKTPETVKPDPSTVTPIIPDTGNKGDPDSSTPDLYVAKTNSYRFLESALEGVNEQLQLNANLTELTDDDEDKMRLLKERVELLKQEQKAQSELANSKRAAIQSNITALKKNYDIDVIYDPNKNELVIQNQERINELQGANIEATNELRKNAEELINETLSLNDANKTLGDNWWSNKAAIQTSLKSISDIQINILKNFTTAQEKLTDVLEKQVESRKKTIEKEYDDLKDAVSDILEELDRANEGDDYDKATKKQQDKIMTLVKKKSSLLLAAKSGDMEAISQLKDIQQEEAEEREKLAEMQSDRQRTLVKQNLQDVVNVAEKSKNVQVDALNEIGDKTKVMATVAEALFQTTMDKYDDVLKKFLLNIGIGEEEVTKIMSDMKPELNTMYNSQKTNVDNMKEQGITASTVTDVSKLVDTSGMNIVQATMAKQNPTGYDTDWKKYITNKYNATLEYQKTTSWSSPTQLQASQENTELRSKYGITSDVLTWEEVQRY